MPDLNGYAFNVHSQYGEDGILQEIFHRLGVERGIAVEFGAWDGVRWANTKLLADQGWRCLLIEPHPKRFDVLEDYAKLNGHVAAKGFVRDAPGERLSDYLSSAHFPDEVDLISVDIDGEDLSAMSTIGRFSAKCIVIEYNRTIPVDFVYSNSPGENVGNSASAAIRVLSELSMSPVAQTQSNLIFLKDELIISGGFQTIEPLTMLAMFVGFNGQLKLGYQATTSEEVQSRRLTYFAPANMVQWPWTLGLVSQPVPRLWRHWPRNQIPLAAWLGIKALLVHPSSMKTLYAGFKTLRTWKARDQELDPRRHRDDLT